MLANMPKKLSSKPRSKLPAGLWLLKSEPDAFSWDMLVAKGKTGEPWEGVRNYQAQTTCGR